MTTWLVWLCVIPPSLALLYFSAEVLLGLRPVGIRRHAPAGVAVAVVIPAHNEALLIAATVHDLRARIEPTTPIVVVADNCTDATADIARAAGATVIERFDLSHRGKGHALACARDALALAPPDAVFILDADCRVSKGDPEAMAGYAVSLGEPVQASNVLTAPFDASPLVLLSNFAMLIKNVVRARGLYRLAGGIPLFGTGMAFPWKVFDQLELATSEPVEDLHLALALAQRGIKVHLFEEVQVTSAAAELDDSLAQRRRWEHGFLSTAWGYGVLTLARALMRRSRHLASLGAHLMVPPLALLLVVAVGASLPAAGLALWEGNILPGALLLGALGLASAAIAAAWHREGRSTIGIRTLVRAPLYVLWKIPLYLGFFSARQTEWNRTKRPNERS